MASPYQEHSRLHVSDEFEFQLRLSEAELALENFFKAYRRDPDDFRKRWSSESYESPRPVMTGGKDDTP